MSLVYVLNLPDDRGHDAVDGAASGILQSGGDTAVIRHGGDETVSTIVDASWKIPYVTMDYAARSAPPR
ncbi:MAG: hypothetical protein M9932_18100 [Xanthobacteraceae bacterium]|nr:hypothetical protein [Xanthobacteraceae bacterium]